MKTLFQKLRHYFVSGLLVLAPLFLTLIFLSYLVRLTDHVVVNPVFRLLPVDHLDVTFKMYVTKVLIGLVVAVLLCVIGLAAERFLFRRLFEAGEAFLKSIPIFNRIYLAIKDIAQAFFGDPSGMFKRVVLIEYPRSGLYAVGFVTQDKPWVAGLATGKDLVNVFVPHPPNPATGFLSIVPREALIEIPLTVEEGLKLIISAGAAVPLKKETSNQKPESR